MSDRDVADTLMNVHISIYALKAAIHQSEDHAYRLLLPACDGFIKYSTDVFGKVSKPDDWKRLTQLVDTGSKDNA